MLEHAFAFVKTVLFQIGETNVRSHKAIEKLGATLKQKINLEGQPHRVYQIQKSDWTPLKNLNPSMQLKSIVEHIRIEMLELHKMLIDQTREYYENQFGKVQNPGSWVGLLIGDPFFKWLAPMTNLITVIDDMLDIELPLREIDAQAVRAEVENLLSNYPTSPNVFHQSFLEILQKNPDIVLKLAKLKNIVQLLPKYDPLKRNDLLKIRKQWITTLKLQFDARLKKRTN